MSEPMRLVFTKCAGKTDRLDIVRANGSVETIGCPKQRIIPHDMVHYAVESTLARRGFLGRVAAGETAAFDMAAENEAEGVERLVEVIQADAWSGGAEAAALFDLYRTTCEARGDTPLSLDEAAIAAVQECMAELEARWQALTVGETMALEFEG
jgi:hypothetical protein